MLPRQLLLLLLSLMLLLFKIQFPPLFFIPCTCPAPHSRI
jgi:hypothetical protein